MTRYQKLLHFWGTLKSNKFNLSLALLFCVFICCLGNLVFVSEVVVTSMITGFFSAIVTTQVFKVSEEYKISCQTYERFLNEKIEFIDYVKINQTNLLSVPVRLECKQKYMKMTDCHALLMYHKDYNEIIKLIKKICDIINSGKNFNLIDNHISRLVNML